MSLIYSVVTLFVAMALLSPVIATSLQQQVFAKPDKPSDPCKAFKFLVEYVKAVGLHAVATGDENEMSNLIDDFQDLSNQILDVSPPDKGKC